MSCFIFLTYGMKRLWQNKWYQMLSMTLYYHDSKTNPLTKIHGETKAAKNQNNG
jgi:hypothetical protein